MTRAWILVVLVAGCSGEKGAPGPEGPTGPSGAMGETPSPAPTFVRTTVVSPVGTAAQNGQALLDAMQAIEDPALLKLEPGVYDVNGISLALKPFVDLEGSGENVTKITNSMAGDTIVAAGNMQVRFLTIDNPGPNGFGISASNANGFSLNHVTINVTGTGLSAIGSGFLTLRDVTIFDTGGRAIDCDASTAETTLTFKNGDISVTAGGAGIHANGCSLVLDSVDISVDGTADTVYGVRLLTGTARAANGQLSNVVVQTNCGSCTTNVALDLESDKLIAADVWSSRLRAAGGPEQAVSASKNGTDALQINLADTQVAGNVVKNGATYTCVGVYDSGYAPVTCPP